MKRGGLRTLFLLAVLVMLAVSVFADEIAQNLESRMIESFDTDSSQKWIAYGSKFATSGYPKIGVVKTWPEALVRSPREATDHLRSLGIQGRFDRKGYNNIEIVPVKEDENGNLVASPIQLPGRVKNLDLWVWGSNLNYYLEVHLRDHNGIVHVLNAGDLRFAGWNKLQVPIPPRISQAVQYIPRFRGLELTKLVLWTRPEEKTDDFYVYIDHMTVFTDMFESPFDGDDLAVPEILEEIWATAE